MNLLQKFTILPRSAKRLIMILVDTVLLISSLWLSFSLRLEEWYWPLEGIEDEVIWLILFAPVLAIPAFMYFGLYRTIIRYLGAKAIRSLVLAVSFYVLIWGVLALLSGVEGIPRSVVLINGLISLLTIGGSRIFARWLFSIVGFNGKNKDTHVRVLIFGAGGAGRQLATGLTQSREYHLCGFVDDQKELQGRELFGVPLSSL